MSTDPLHGLTRHNIAIDDLADRCALIVCLIAIVAVLFFI